VRGVTELRRTAPGESREIIILLGETVSAEEARDLIARYLQSVNSHETIERVVSHWDEHLPASKSRTPDAAMNLMLNRWLCIKQSPAASGRVRRSINRRRIRFPRPIARRDGLVYAKPD